MDDLLRCTIPGYIPDHLNLSPLPGLVSFCVPRFPWLAPWANVFRPLCGLLKDVRQDRPVADGPAWLVQTLD